MKQSQDVIVVGAGHNGLIAACYLAHAGLSVHVLEQRHFVGGACVTEELIPGYRFSTCAGVCWKLQQQIVDDLQLDRRLRHARLDPDPVNLYAGDLALPVWADQQRTSMEIARISRDDGERYAAWRSFWKAAAEVVDSFLLQDPPSAAELERRAQSLGAGDVWAQLQERSLGEICTDFFNDGRIQAAFVNVDDVGDPWAPRGGLLEAYFQSQGAFGSAFLIGGMGSLTQALCDIARERGVEISTGVSVRRILMDADGVQGVELDDGRCIRAAVVASTMDPLRTLALAEGEPSLLTDSVSAGRGPAGLRSTAGCLKLHGVLDAAPSLASCFGGRPVPAYGQVRIAPSLDHYLRGHEAAERGEMPAEPVVYMHLPSPYDSSLADGEGQCVSLFVRNAPVVLSGNGWDAGKEAIGSAVIDYVDEFVPGFRANLREHVLLSPADIEQRVGLTNGNIHHLDMVPSQLFSGRIRYATTAPGLFLCGAGTHPGGEVSGAPGYNGARAILQAGADRRSEMRRA